METRKSIISRICYVFDIAWRFDMRMWRVIIFSALVLVLSNVFAFAGSDEIEPNNTKREANAISAGTVIYGVSDKFDYFGGTGNGEDWFKFEAPISGTVKITVYADEVTAEDNYAAVDVYDGNDRKICSAQDSIDTDGGSSATFGVVSGKIYYVRASGDHWGFFREGVHYHFKIDYYIGKTSIKKTVPGKKKFTVKWEKKSGASFYEIQYVKKSIYRDYGWNQAKVKVSKKNSININKLAKKRKYYVRVRVARSIQGMIYYSDWSTKKLVKTK